MSYGASYTRIIHSASEEDQKAFSEGSKIPYKIGSLKTDPFLRREARRSQIWSESTNMSWPPKGMTKKERQSRNALRKRKLAQYRRMIYKEGL